MVRPLRRSVPCVAEMLRGMARRGRVLAAVAAVAVSVLAGDAGRPAAQDLPAPPEGVPFVPLYRTGDVALAGFLDVRAVPASEERAVAVHVAADREVRGVSLDVSGPQGRPSWQVRVGRTGDGEVEGRNPPEIRDVVRDGTSLAFVLDGLPDGLGGLRLERVVVPAAGGPLLGAPTPLLALAGGGDDYELGLGPFGVRARAGVASADAPPLALPPALREVVLDLTKRDDGRASVVLAGVRKVDRFLDRPVIDQRAVVNLVPDAAPALQARYVLAVDLATDAAALAIVRDSGEQTTQTLRARRSGDRLTIPLPAGVEVTPELLTALSAAMQVEGGDGLVASTPLVPVGALTGETPLPPLPELGAGTPTTTTTAGADGGSGETNPDGDSGGGGLVVALIVVVGGALGWALRNKPSASERAQQKKEQEGDDGGEGEGAPASETVGEEEEHAGPLPGDPPD